MAPARHEALAICAPGVEHLVVAELQALGVRPGRVGGGTVPFRATTRQLYAANLWLRTAERVQVRVAAFDAPDLGSLERGAARIDWAPWVRPGDPVEVRATSHGSRLHHTGAVEARVLDAIGSPPAPRPGTGRSDEVMAGDGVDPLGQHPVVRVRVSSDRVTVSVDASGAPLHRRGWRRRTGRAPLRETVAAAVLAACGWTPDSPLLDPCCGSGTLPIEAALAGRRLPPGQHRDFGFRRWPSFEPGTWASVTGQAAGAALPATPAPVLASDRDAGAVASTRANAERAGVADDLEVLARSLSAVEAPDGVTGWVVTNPPWGGRVTGGGDLRDLYARLGQVVSGPLGGWSLALVIPTTPDGHRLARATGLPLEPCLELTTGGMRLAALVHRPVTAPR